MNRNRLFWGLLVILLGCMLLLNTLGILTINAWSIFWPLVLILVGGWMLLGPVFFKRSTETQNISLPLGTASSLRLKVNHGAGHLNISSANPGNSAAVSGTFVGGVEYDSRLDGNEMKVKLKAPSDMFTALPFAGFEGYTWDVNLSRDIPIRLIIHSGASESNLDLSDLRISDLELETGASSTQIILPANAVYSRVRIETGASSVNIKVPEGVAGRFNIKHGLAGINVDTSRFPQNGDVYETPGFGTATNRVEVNIETGVGSIDIH